MVSKQPRYFSYLLRLWSTSSDGEQIWRASLESPGAGKRQGFANLKTLIDFLESQTSQTALANKGGDGFGKFDS